MNRPHSLALITVAGLALAHIASADIILVEDNRMISARVSVTNASGTQVDGPYVFEPAFGEALDSGVFAAVGENTALAEQTSSISSTAIAMSSHLHAHLSASAGVTNILCRALSVVDLVFDVTPGTELEFNALSIGAGTFQASDSSGVFISTMGTYRRLYQQADRIHLSTTSISELGFMPGINRSGVASIYVTVIPSADGAAGLAGLALFAARRRRAC